MHNQVNLSLPQSAPPITMLRLSYIETGRASTVRSSAPIAPSKQAAIPVLHRNLNDRFGERLRELRRERNMTQLRMAVDFGIDRSFISDVERGRKSISLQFLEVIALGMGMELSELLNGL
jgi:DNA-binding XRE family transcriptional regulator